MGGKLKRRGEKEEGVSTVTENEIQINTVNLAKVEAKNRIETSEQRLLQFLMKNYEKSVRPVRNPSHTVTVKLGMTMTNIFEMDEKNQVLTINVWLDQEWKDELLQWDPSDFDGIESIRIPSHLIWLPDIVLYNKFVLMLNLLQFFSELFSIILILSNRLNDFILSYRSNIICHFLPNRTICIWYFSADDYSIGHVESRAMLFYDGSVFWPPPAQLRSTCKVDVTYFPFDRQHCALKFGSWSYHGIQLDIINRSENVDLSNYVISGEFDLVNVNQKRKVVKYNCCPELYPDVTFFIHIQRKTLYYLYNIILPCLMMSILTLLVFLLPPDSGEKIALGITVLLAFSVFVLTIAEKIPETSDSVPLIGIYLSMVMGMTSISVVMTVMVLNFHHRGPYCRTVPPWIRFSVLGKLRKILKMQLKHNANNNNDILSADENPTDFDLKCAIGKEFHFLNFFSFSLSTIEKLNLQRHRQDFIFLYQVQSHQIPEIMFILLGLSVTGYDGLDNQPFISESALLRRNVGEKHSENNCTVTSMPDEHIYRALRMLLKKRYLEECSQRVINEWQQVAQIIDRFLFWVFLICTIVISIILLIIVPVVHRLSNLDKFDDERYGI
ncbi:unnamed protein product [Dracunculus medinensis]|uniref:Neur_chan_LBD domain-containing protein n=1 Tax=Dracunculus medinensis TaxID=318479 RepID=A0A158Q470_DRAME|nr:unnamed protein product [Dracunculus medinensis]